MKQKQKTDAYYIDAFSVFVRKFNCAADYIKTQGILIHDRIDNKWFAIAGLREYDELGVPKIRGPHYPKGSWIKPPIDRLLAVSIANRRVHPFAYLLDGRHSYTEEPHRDIERLFGFVPETITHAFAQGYYNSSSYRDMYASSNYHWSVSAGFNVGRYMINKHFIPQFPGRNVLLAYNTPPQLAGILK